MTKTLVCTAFCLFLALPAFADTRTGNANGTSIHKWEIYNVESGISTLTGPAGGVSAVHTAALSVPNAVSGDHTR